MERKSLDELLNEIPEFSDEWLMHAFCFAYEGQQYEKWVLEFWGGVLERIAQAHDLPLILTEQILWTVLERKGRSVLALENIIKDLVQEGDLVKLQWVRDRATGKREKNWKSWLSTKVKSLIKYDQDRRFLVRTHLVRVASSVKKLIYSQMRLCFSVEEIERFLRSTWGFDEEETGVVIDYLIAEDILEPEKAGVYEKSIESYRAKLPGADCLADQKDDVLVGLKLTQSRIEGEISKLTRQTQGLRQQYEDLEEMQDPETVNEFLRREKIIYDKIERLLDKNSKIEEFSYKMISKGLGQSLSNSMRFSEMSAIKDNQETQELIEEGQLLIKEFE